MTKYTYFSVLALFLFLPVICFSQLSDTQQAGIDSLKQVIETADHDSVVIKAWFAWGEILSPSDPEFELELNQKIAQRCEERLAISNQPVTSKEKNFYELFLAYAYNNIGVVYGNRGDYAKAMKYHSQSLAIKEKLGNKPGIAASLNSIGIIYHKQSDYVKALEYYSESLRIREELGNKSEIATSLNNMGKYL